MQRRITLPLSSIALAIFAVALFTVARFFYIEVVGITEICQHYRRAAFGCFDNDANRTSMIVLWIGAIMFSLTGLTVWSAATFTAFKWYQQVRRG